jgi:hypothetical protein
MRDPRLEIWVTPARPFKLEAEGKAGGMLGGDAKASSRTSVKKSISR